MVALFCQRQRTLLLLQHLTDGEVSVPGLYHGRNPVHDWGLRLKWRFLSTTPRPAGMSTKLNSLRCAASRPWLLAEVQTTLHGEAAACAGCKAIDAIRLDRGKGACRGRPRRDGRGGCEGW